MNDFSFENNVKSKNSVVYKSCLIVCLRVLTICIGSFTVGFNLIYYYAITEWYCVRKACKDNFICQDWGTVNFRSNIYLFSGSILPISACVGSLLGYLLKKHFSHRIILIIASFIGIIGSIFSILSYCLNQNQQQQIFIYHWFVIGRIFIGVSVGMYMVFCLVFINQFCPYELKLVAVGIYQITIQLGQLTCNIIFPILSYATYFNKYLDWNSSNEIMYSILIFAYLIQILLLIFVYSEQSPLQLIQQKRDKQAKFIISQIYEQDYIEQKFIEIQSEVKIDEGSFYCDYDKQSLNRKGIFLGIYVIVVQQMSGINFLNAFGFYLSVTQYNETKQQIDSLPTFTIISNALPNIFQLLGTLILLMISYFFKKINFFKSNRKTYIKNGTIAACIIMATALVLQILQFKKIIGNDETMDAFSNHNQIYWLYFECVYMLCFGFTLGTITWVYLSEMLKSNQLRFVVSSYWILAFVNMYVFQFLRRQAKNHWVIPFLFFICCLLFSFTNEYYVIETKNQSTLQIIRKIDQVKYIPCIKQN